MIHLVLFDEQNADLDVLRNMKSYAIRKVLHAYLAVMSFTLSAQTLPDIQVQKVKPSYYASLQAKAMEQSTSDFQLKGPVKSVCETVNSLDTIRNRHTFLQTETFFSEQGKLLRYSRDTLSTLYTDEVKEFVNTYDSTGKTLLESVVYNGGVVLYSKTQRKLNARGFLEKETYTRYHHEESPYRNEKGIFDYWLDYHWSPDFDSVSLKYHYLKPKSLSPYQRYQDVTHSFVREQGMEKYKLEHPDQIDEPDVIGFQFFVNEIKKDEKGRISEWFIWDYEIKNSMNVYQKFEYVYNDRDELTEIRHFSMGETADEFELNYQIDIRYVSYDPFGNWTEKEVYVTGTNRGYHPMFGKTVYHFKRQYNYY